MTTETTVYVDKLFGATGRVHVVAQVRHVDPDGTMGPPIEIIEERFLLGRGSDVDMMIPDSQVSRHHAQIIRQAGEFMVEDLGSTNGTFVNGVRVRRCRLTPGDQLQFGAHRVYFTVGHDFDVL